MNMTAFIAVFCGAGFGAIFRWFLGILLNGLFPRIPLGTLSVNLLGGYLIGIAMTYFATRYTLPPEWRLFIVTGFLGGLTTFSTFSAEVMTLISQNEWLWTLILCGAHVLGALVCVALGIYTCKLFLH